MSEQHHEDAASPAVELVRELIDAICEGRLDDIRARVHPEVVWMPLARPGLTQYRGHEGMVRFVTDLQAAYGPFRLEVDEVTPVEDGQVLLVAHVVQLTEAGERRLPRITGTFTMIDGRVVSMDARQDSL